MKKIIPLIVLSLLMVPAFVGLARSNQAAVKPSIVLVHGAWADGAGWSGVVSILQDAGYTVYVPANPLRNLTSDSEYIADFLHTISGPIVLVGHSYGGAVITNAATGNTNVKALVFVDAFAPDQGETLGALANAPTPPGQPASCLSGDPTQVFNFVPLTGGDVDVYLKPSLFPACFANTIDHDEAAVLASSQRPIALSIFGEKSGVPAWKTIPSWYAVGSLDKVLPPWAQLFMAQRAHSTIVQIEGPHPSMITQPEAIAELIQQAAGQPNQEGTNIAGQEMLAPVRA